MVTSECNFINERFRVLYEVRNTDMTHRVNMSIHVCFFLLRPSSAASVVALIFYLGKLSRELDQKAKAEKQKALEIQNDLNHLAQTVFALLCDLVPLTTRQLIERNESKKGKVRILHEKEVVKSNVSNSHLFDGAIYVLTYYAQPSAIRYHYIVLKANMLFIYQDEQVRRAVLCRAICLST